MSKRFVLLFAFLALLVPSGAALADRPPPGGNTGKPTNPPCDADHGHPGERAKPCRQAPPPADRCSAEDPTTAGLAGDTIAQRVFESPLGAAPVLKDPDAEGPVSGGVEAAGNGTPLDPVTNEVGCLASVTVAPL